MHPQVGQVNLLDFHSNGDSNCMKWRAMPDESGHYWKEALSLT